MHDRDAEFSFNMSHTWKLDACMGGIFLCLCFNCAGQLSVEGGSRSYSEGVARPTILRPQPVPCVSVPSLCYPLRETDCSYQSFCQHQLCCLHCRPAPSVPLEKYPPPLDKYSVPHAQDPSCSSPLSLHRSWNSDATAQVYPAQNSTLPESVQRSPDPDPVKHPAARDFQPQGSREPPADQENPQLAPEKQHEDPPGAECSEERLSAHTDEDRVSRWSGQSCACVQRALQGLHL